MENNLENNFVKTHRGSGDLRLTWPVQPVWPETKTKHTLLEVEVEDMTTSKN